MQRARLPKPLSETETKLFDFVVDSVKHLDVTLRIAGGWVRDKMLGKFADDIDITIETPQGRPYISGEQLAEVLSKATATDTRNQHPHVAVIKTNPDKSKHIETAVIHIMGQQLEFCHLRKDDYTGCSPIMRTPTVTVAHPDEDAQRRDFCCNALYYNLHTREVEDFVGGLEDLKSGVLRCPLDPYETFTDDPLRMLRGIRFSGKLGFSIHPSITETILVGDPIHEPGFFTHEWKSTPHKMLVWELLRKVSRERYGIECNKMFSGPRPFMCCDNLARHQLLYSAILLEMVPTKVKKGASADYDRVAMIVPREMWDGVYQKHTAPILKVAFADGSAAAVHGNNNGPATAAAASTSTAADIDNNNTETQLTNPSDRAVTTLFALLASPIVLLRDEISTEIFGKMRSAAESPIASALHGSNNPGKTNTTSAKVFTFRDEILKRSEAVVQNGLKLPRKVSEEVGTLLLALETMFRQYDGVNLIRKAATAAKLGSPLNDDDAAPPAPSSSSTSNNNNNNNSSSMMMSFDDPQLRTAIFHSLRGIKNSSLPVTLAFLRVVGAYAFNGDEASARLFVDSLSTVPKNQSLFRVGELVPLVKGDEIIASILTVLPRAKISEVLTTQLQYLVDHPDATKEEVINLLITKYGDIGLPKEKQQQQQD